MLELQRKGQFAETIEPLRALLKENPTDPRLNRLYGESLLRVGEFASAVWPLQRAAQSPEFGAEAGLLLVSAELQNGSENDAIESASRILERDPGNLEARGLRAQAYLQAMQESHALEDLDRLIEAQPDDLEPRVERLIALLRLGKLDDVDVEIAKIEDRILTVETPDPALVGNLCIVKATFEHERGNRRKGAEQWKRCVAEHPADPTVVDAAIAYYSDVKDGARVTEVLEAAVAAAPEEVNFRTSLATRYRAMGRPKDAEALLVEGTQKYPSPRSFGALADYYSEQRDYASARRALEQAMGLMQEVPEMVLFGYADVLIQMGDRARAQEVAEKVKLPVYRHLLLGRLHFADGDPAGALQELEAGIQLWPNNASARELAGRAAEQLGDFTTAASHYREAVREKSADAAVALAELHAARGEFRVGLEVVRSSLVELPYESSLWLMQVRIAGEAKQDAAVREGLNHLADLWGGLPLATAEAMKLSTDARGPSAALEWLKNTPLDLSDPANEPVLQVYVDSKLALGRSADALQHVDAAIQAHPDHAGFQALRGRILIHDGSLDAAEAALQRALQLDPGSSAALQQLAVLAEKRGQTALAIEYYDKAAASDATDPAPGWSAFRLARASGLDPAELTGRLERYLRAHPHSGEAALALAELRMRAGDLKGAQEMAQRAISFGAGAPGSETLACVQTELGDARGAVETLGRMSKEDQERPAAQYCLGRALAATGDRAGARAALERSLAGGAFPEAEQARAELTRLAGDNSSPR
ncbi:MAG TPA: tetratricopeptide repeat protein [Myxococcota bacterium]|nr:tetratricopeptide repeat protein [Myxococcota bacterium]